MVRKQVGDFSLHSYSDFTSYVRYFSPAVRTPESRRVFAENILAVYNAFNLDGIDLDWEYPGHQGAEGNLVDPHDTANFLLFLQYLRTVLPPCARISAAAQTLPFVDAQEQPLQDVSDFADSLDWVLIMNYDVWGCKFLWAIVIAWLA